MNFLQGHYNQYRLMGGKHNLYVVYNDISNESGEELRRNYLKYKKRCLQRKRKKRREK